MKFTIDTKLLREVSDTICQSINPGKGAEPSMTNTMQLVASDKNLSISAWRGYESSSVEAIIKAGEGYTPEEAGEYRILILPFYQYLHSDILSDNLSVAEESGRINVADEHGNASFLSVPSNLGGSGKPETEECEMTELAIDEIHAAIIRVRRSAKRDKSEIGGICFDSDDDGNSVLISTDMYRLSMYPIQTKHTELNFSETPVMSKTLADIILNTEAVSLSIGDSGEYCKLLLNGYINIAYKWHGKGNYPNWRKAIKDDNDDCIEIEIKNRSLLLNALHAVASVKEEQYHGVKISITASDKPKKGVLKLEMDSTLGKTAYEIPVVLKTHASDVKPMHINQRYLDDGICMMDEDKPFSMKWHHHKKPLMITQKTKPIRVHAIMPLNEVENE